MLLVGPARLLGLGKVRCPDERVVAALPPACVHLLVDNTNDTVINDDNIIDITKRGWIQYISFSQ